jgi:predicted amidophosphoribosyltransferase
MLREWGWEVELIVSLLAKRSKEHGYKQVMYLPLPLTVVLYSRLALRRTREMLSQVGLSQKELWENVAGAFEAQPYSVRGRQILLVDDVITTGATLNTEAEALCQVGAAQVYAITLSRARGLTAA